MFVLERRFYKNLIGVVNFPEKIAIVVGFEGYFKGMHTIETYFFIVAIDGFLSLLSHHAYFGSILYNKAQRMLWISTANCFRAGVRLSFVSFLRLCLGLTFLYRSALGGRLNGFDLKRSTNF